MAQYPVTPKGRMPNRVGEQAGVETQTAAPSVDLNAMFGTGDLKEAPVSPVAEPAPAQETPKESEKKSPKKSTKPKTNKPSPEDDAQKATPSEKEEAEANSAETAGKDKYSIYLPKPLSLNLRIASITTRKPYSTLTEMALDNMLNNQYQCHKCATRFSMSENCKVPGYCPGCGEKAFSPLRYDFTK